MFVSANDMYCDRFGALLCILELSQTQDEEERKQKISLVAVIFAFALTVIYILDIRLTFTQCAQRTSALPVQYISNGYVLELDVHSSSSYYFSSNSFSRLFVRLLVRW